VQRRMQRKQLDVTVDRRGTHSTLICFNGYPTNHPHLRSVHNNFQRFERNATSFAQSHSSLFEGRRWGNRKRRLRLMS